jgi:glycogen operon protein
MICGGDEYGRTQRGNNNDYCQDNEIILYNWAWSEKESALCNFTRKLIKIRRDFPVLRRRKFFQGRRIRGTDIQDIRWVRPDGEDMTEEEWNTSFVRVLGMLLNGQVMDEYNEKGERIKDDVLLLLCNGYWDRQPFKMPGRAGEPAWEVLVDTYSPEESPNPTLACGEIFDLKPRSFVLLRQPLRNDE